MSQFTIYRYSDASAPTLTGAAGSLTDLLDAVLVNGYGAKAAAGWSIAFTDTNKRVYQQGSGTGFYYRIDDTAPTTAKEARIRGYESMSDVDTGVEAFPTVAQMANGCFIRKSTSVDAVARQWTIAADDQTCYIFIKTGDFVGYYYGAGFGDFYALNNAEGYNAFVCARVTENSGLQTSDRLDSLQADATIATGFFVPRDISGTAPCIDCGRHGDRSYMSTAYVGSGSMIYPNIGGQVMASRVWITETLSSGIRGWLRGFWAFLHPSASVRNNTTATGSDELTGKDFLFVKYSANTGLYMIETSDTLDTNT